MNPYGEMKIFVDVNSGRLPTYRVEIEAGDEKSFRGDGYSIDEAVRDALASEPA